MGPATSGSDQPNRPISVRITVGLTLFILIPFGPNSSAAALVKASTAPLEAQYTVCSFKPTTEACEDMFTIVPGTLRAKRFFTTYLVMLMTALTLIANTLKFDF